ncbi:Lrp/AsnC family transcriptional regulator [Mobilicoccus pelagius]|uniref:Putative AsnC family transcriptional regulator n=1 Tax=Mobilicoccus pelagius NBRC 104925 TaxID=1089455 RepID=H5USN0_9MICO|nr:Lrp/AsnC family transcriptional regulator [Mobilicoccus pelagius]GAB48738.1 putative AsnC family transcriptional regulator [Mobilicoccus pelagius NBRC 104925]
MPDDVTPHGARLDEIDRRLLATLDDDPRATVLTLADRAGLARGTVQSRLERYQRDGLLRAHSTRIDPAALGRPLSAMVSAELDQHHIDDACAALARIPEVLECFAPAGETDLLCRVVARDPDDLYRVSEEIRLCPGILRTRTSVYLRRVIPYRTRLLLEEGLTTTAPAPRPRRGGAAAGAVRSRGQRS